MVNWHLSNKVSANQYRVPQSGLKFRAYQGHRFFYRRPKAGSLLDRRLMSE